MAYQLFSQYQSQTAPTAKEFSTETSHWNEYYLVKSKCKNNECVFFLNSCFGYCQKKKKNKSLSSRKRVSLTCPCVSWVSLAWRQWGQNSGSSLWLPCSQAKKIRNFSASKWDMLYLKIFFPKGTVSFVPTSFYLYIVNICPEGYELSSLYMPGNWWIWIDIWEAHCGS